MGHKYQLTVLSNINSNITSKFKFLDVKVLKQLDLKYICCATQELNATWLYLMDQHAVHERVCLERLLKIHCRKNLNRFAIRSSVCYPLIKIKLSPVIFNGLKKFQECLPRYGVQLSFLDKNFVETTHIPTCFTTQALKLKGKKLHHLLYTFLEDVSFNISMRKYSFPKAIGYFLSSLACRGAVKFGDRLSRKQAQQLVEELGKCEIPFQCAHGRCSVVTLFNLREINTYEKTPIPKPNYGSLFEKPTL